MGIESYYATSSLIGPAGRPSCSPLRIEGAQLVQPPADHPAVLQPDVHGACCSFNLSVDESVSRSIGQECVSNQGTWGSIISRLHTHDTYALTHDDAVAERGPVLELQRLEDVPELLRHGSVVDCFGAGVDVEVQSRLSEAPGVF